jgi:raffinose/stachyose/melibiose transport system permease protein
MNFKTEKHIHRVIRTLIAFALLILFIYPAFYVIMSSLKTVDDFRKLPSYALPSGLNFKNYINVFVQSKILIYYKNSIIITMCTILLLLTLASTAAFAISKINFKGRHVMLRFFNLGIILPMQVALIPLFYVFSRINILNTYPAVILPQVAFSLSFSIQLFFAFYKFLPNDVIESGVIDGCHPMGIFAKICVPMSQNIFLTVATMQGVFCWNEFICTYTFTKSVSMKTVTLGLNDFVGVYGLTDWGATFAMIAVTVLPTVILYFFTNKYLLSGLTAGAVKE